MDKLLIAIIALFIIAGGVYFFVGYKAETPENNQPPATQNITNFEECAAAGNPVTESYPRSCSTNGKTYTENIGNANELNGLITVDTPRPNAVVVSPLTITGQARGTWYFEAQFPVKLVDANGQTLAQTPAMAQSDWMSENFVPFAATLEFTAPATPTGTLILQNDNPSGNPETAKQLEIPVRFR